MTINKDRPVWITGTRTTQSSRSVTIKAVDRTLRSRDVVIAKVHVLEERNTPGAYSFDYKVPQWVAYQNKLDFRAAD
ncbi:MAG: hypothetical protein A2Y38_19850 [Spirochaetes bacterium GWB1_59_5]|nr:MAG: hypothetical protein A2Y38_19850 [Spirochaetes bacterium GWB1_59_5]